MWMFLAENLLIVFIYLYILFLAFMILQENTRYLLHFANLRNSNFLIFPRGLQNTRFPPV